MKPEIAVIGYGRFGRFAVEHLRKDFRVVVANLKRLRSLPRGVRCASTEEAARSSIIVLAVPINTLPAVLRSITPHLRRNALICDTCSVKEQPIQWMTSILPTYVHILGMHPLFGPDSAADRLTGRNVILCPVRISARKYASVTSYLRRKGLCVHKLSPSQHDRLMASTLFLTQFVGHGLRGVHLPDTPIATQNYQHLVQILRTTQNDSRELFRDMFAYNRYARAVPQQYLRSFSRLVKYLSRRSHDTTTIRKRHAKKLTI
jgi:prephenate dehydrogenase